ncbi:hypothetical protein KBA27_03005 [bacterium]|nr:hypothetical protein [bacterium]
MTIKAISPMSNQNNLIPSTSSRKASFRGFNPVVGLMDGIAAGGLAASFLTQDFCGMGLPRTAKALYRNKDQNDGKYNFGYAWLVLKRELISGPAAFIIPGILSYNIKKLCGRANNVGIDAIKNLSTNYGEYAKTLDSKVIGDEKTLKSALYKHSAENMLKESLPNLKGEEFDKTVTHFAEKFEEAGSAKLHFIKSRKGDTKDIRDGIIDEYRELRKKYASPTASSTGCSFKVTGKDGVENSDLEKYIKNVNDYTEDISSTISKKFKGTDGKIEEFIKDFGKRKVGSRWLTNGFMTLAAVMFYVNIPKIYNTKDKSNPALAGLDAPESKRPQIAEQNKEVKNG